ncbi:choline/ethanolamine kinase isoform X2 [Ctenocephalides felis]|uniref:choline/ethanolamine kinase isoform X2 n=1 Tax=Ctenocephalides felis TaxID=7515 RepID=UPI000E6E444C|nr:choline/ethanolamine kinase isoform X2 [Ctenocephalides felis]
MNLNETEMRDTAARICRDYLTGAWRTVKPQDLLFKRISGGLSNFLYHVALPESAVVEHSEPSSAPSSGSVTANHQNGYHQNGDHIDTSFASKYSENFLRRSSDEDLLKTFNDESGYCLKEEYNLDTLSDSSDSEECGFQGEPRQVLLRIYGQIHGDQAVEAIITESVIFTLLSERRLGPKLHGVFPGGRIEQYIPARPLRTKEMSDPVLCVKIAEKMSAIHSMHVPLSKEPDWLWKTMNKWITTAENNLERHQMKDDHESSTVDHIRQMKLRSEIEWLKQFVQGCGSPVVFSHNDMQEGNILLRQTRHHTNNLEDTGIHGKGVQVADVVVVENSCDGVDSRSYVEPPLTEDDGIACDFSQQMALKDNTDLFESSHPQTKNLHLLQNQNSNHLTSPSLEDCLTSSTSSSSSSDSVLSRSSKKSSLNNNEPELVLIDFEYCSYNYRGFDLANHFIEWTYDYSNADYPYFYDRPEDYPTEEQQFKL